jgi:hypothetical protein
MAGVLRRSRTLERVPTEDARRRLEAGGPANAETEEYERDLEREYLKLSSLHPDWSDWTLHGLATLNEAARRQRLGRPEKPAS